MLLSKANVIYNCFSCSYFPDGLCHIFPHGHDSAPVDTHAPLMMPICSSNTLNQHRIIQRRLVRPSVALPLHSVEELGAQFR